MSNVKTLVLVSSPITYKMLGSWGLNDVFQLFNDYRWIKVVKQVNC